MNKLKAIVVHQENSMGYGSSDVCATFDADQTAHDQFSPRGIFRLSPSHVR